jgi:hypothetical protein
MMTCVPKPELWKKFGNQIKGRKGFMMKGNNEKLKDKRKDAGNAKTQRERKDAKTCLLTFLPKSLYSIITLKPANCEISNLSV